MQTSLFDYHLPKELIAQSPASPRDSSRLLVYNRAKDKIIHDRFYNLKKYLKHGDVLVFNNTKVFPARLILQKETIGKVEIFLLQDLGQGKWECLVGGKIKKGQELFIIGTSYGVFKVGTRRCLVQSVCKVLEKNKNGNWIVQIVKPKGLSYKDVIDKYGQTPIPPYIKTKDSKLIKQRYQTVYAKHKGSVAAPTAGLHFTKRLLKELNKFGVQLEFITLHVGLGTFAPIKTEKIEQHQLHVEYAVLDKQTCARLNQAKQDGRRIIAVGTTSLRVLEAVAKHKQLKPIRKWINLFIYPGYKFKFVNGMLTNFHLPKSSLLVLVSALVGRQKILKIYHHAIKKGYRFYSFGDAMLIID